MNFCHLHLHNQYSILDGIGTSTQYAEAAKELGQTHIALTNHGNIDGAIEHQKQCKKAGVKPLIGCELYVVDDLKNKEKKESRYHMTVLVENETGWRNLSKMLTIANVEGFYHRPRVDFNTVADHLEGLVLLSGCALTFLNLPGWKGFLNDAIDIIGKDKIFLEVMPHDYEPQFKVNERAISLSKFLGVRTVATNDCHYPSAKSSYHQEILLAIQSKKKMTDNDRWKFSISGLYLKSRDEMLDAFDMQNVLNDDEICEALDNTNAVAEICEGFEIQQCQPTLPSIGDFNGSSDFSVLRKLVFEGRNAKGVEKYHEPEYKERANEELELIKAKQFERYFLVVYDLISWCKKNNIMTGPGRGSVGGSLIAFFLGITDVDPIKYDLVFSRFISHDRIDLPDIDMDFEDHKRHLVRQYLMEKYGEYNVAGLSTFMTMKGKGILRDISRVFDVPLKEVDTAAKAIDETVGNNEQIKHAFSEISECQRFKRRYPDVVDAAECLEGQIRGVGQHAAAVCVSSIDLREGGNCNLALRSGQVVANWDKDNAEFMGLIKLDILGLSALSVLSETRLMVMKNHGVEVDFQKLTLDDKAVYDEINSGNTVGAFQIKANGLSSYCQKLGIDRFDDLVAATALFRPGPLHSGMAEEFVKIKNGQQKVKKIHPVYDEITKDTHGIIVYQEQVMSVINQLSGIDMSTCDKIRKLMAKSKGAEALNRYKAQFVDGCAALKTVNEKQADSIWETISTFGKYGFNKAHSVGYSLITYWDMWFKTYYPNEFLACSLSFGNKDQLDGYLREARRLKLDIRLPKIGCANAINWSADLHGNLFAPFLAVSGIGEASAYVIAEYKPFEKKQTGFFKTLDNDTQKIPGVNKTQLAILEKIKAFSPLGEITVEERKAVKSVLMGFK